MSPVGHVAATCGADGSVRLWDYEQKALVCTSRFSAAATSLVWGSESVDVDGRSLAVGFADGTMRVLKRCSDGLVLGHVLKPHAVSLSHLLYSPDGTLLATAAEDGAVFFISVRHDYKPLGFMQGEAAITAVAWAAGAV